MADLEALAKTAREIANECFRTEALPCANQRTDASPTCIQAEEDRPLTRAEKAKGWARRGFADYDTARMCRACEAYYHAERAAQLLHEARCWQVRIEAEAASKAAV
jgi:hypothetical protein